MDAESRCPEGAENLPPSDLPPSDHQPLWTVEQRESCKLSVSQVGLSGHLHVSSKVVSQAWRPHCPCKCRPIASWPTFVRAMCSAEQLSLTCCSWWVHFCPRGTGWQHHTTCCARTCGSRCVKMVTFVARLSGTSAVTTSVTTCGQPRQSPMMICVPAARQGDSGSELLLSAVP